MGYLDIARKLMREQTMREAREEIDRFFVSEILPRLSALYRAGKLPDLSSCLLWQDAEQLWNTLAEGSFPPAPVETIKAAMRKAVASYKEGRA